MGTASRAELVRAMEVGIAFSPDDFRAYCAGPNLPHPLSPISRGFAYSGSFAGRNIEKIYALGGQEGSLEAAVRACFGSEGEAAPVRHVLVCSGFYCLHNFGSFNPGSGAGSCETDGPLGALALVRAFAARGVRVSLYCEPHNGPVLRAGYDAMLRHFERASPAMAELLRTHSRCLPDATDGAGEPLSPELADSLSRMYPGEPLPLTSSGRSRSVRSALELRKSVSAAWGPSVPGDIDLLFAIERLSAPYRNIRGVDISVHTEPIDALWPPAIAPEGSPAVDAMSDFWQASGVAADPTALRELAGVSPNALSIGIGDGGNEVGMGKVSVQPAVAVLSPGGEFAQISVNGAYRACDHLIVGTVSNWAGTAFEAAAHVLVPPAAALDYVSYDDSVEKTILDAITAAPAGSVDGKYPAQQNSVDGMTWEPHHREYYEFIWDMAKKVQNV